MTHQAIADFFPDFYLPACIHQTDFNKSLLCTEIGNQQKASSLRQFCTINPKFNMQLISSAGLRYECTGTFLQLICDHG